MGGGAGITRFLGEQKRDQSLLRTQKGGSLKTLEGFKRRPLKFAWKMKTWGGSRELSNVIREGHFSEVTFKVGGGGGSAEFHLV